MWNYTPASKIGHMRIQMEAYYKHLYSVRNTKSIVQTTTPYKPYYLSVCSRYQNKYEDRMKLTNAIQNCLIEYLILILEKGIKLIENEIKIQIKYESLVHQQKQRLNNSSRKQCIMNNQQKKISDRIYSAKSQYTKKRQLRHNSQFERYSKNISQNARRSSHYDFNQMLLSKSFDNKLNKPLLRSSYVSSQNQYSEPSPYYSENTQVYF